MGRLKGVSCVALLQILDQGGLCAVVAQFASYVTHNFEWNLETTCLPDHNGGSSLQTRLRQLDSEHSTMRSKHRSFSRALRHGYPFSSASCGSAQ